MEQIAFGKISKYNVVKIPDLMFPADVQRKWIAMDAEIKSAVNATEQNAQYDEKAKRLLGNKNILAHIREFDS